MAISVSAARITFWAAALFLALLAVLHILKPEYDPSWRMISEYEIGRFGWVMQLAFFFLAIAHLSVIAAVWPQAKSIIGYIGLGLLLVASIGLIISGIFPSDPITTDPEALSASGKMHALGGMLGIPVMPVAVALVSWALIQHNQAWASMRLWLWLAVGLIWLSFLAFVFLGFVAKGKLGPDVLIGWPNRLFIIGCSLWLMIVARHAVKLPTNSLDLHVRVIKIDAENNRRFGT